MDATTSTPAARSAPAARPTSARRAIDECGLDASVRTLIATIVRHAGGTRRERCDVALELIGHFGDARAAGQTPEQAIADFGDARTAAKLIRRAVFRKRGAFQRGWWWTTRGIAGCLAATVCLYGLLAIRFFAGAPTISVDSIAALRALAPAGAREQQAWPLYREAMTNLMPLEKAGWYQSGDTSKGVGPLESEDPTSATWGWASDALAEHRADLERIRRAAGLPTFGIEYGELSAADRAHFGLVADPQATDDSIWRGSTMTMLLPYLTEVRRAARWLACDAHHAVADGDGGRAVENIEAIAGIAIQLRRPILIDQLVGFAVLSLALDTTQKLVARDPQVFTEPELARLAAFLDELDASPLRIDFSGERIGTEDLIQRLYTDDGDGDGRLAPSALDQDALFTSIGARPPGRSAVHSALGPAYSLTAPSRRELREQVERRIAAAEALQRKPVWDWSEAEHDALVNETRPGRDLLRLAGLDGLGGNLAGVSAINLVPPLELRLDVTRLAVALARHRAKQGEWPASIDDIDCTLLREPARDIYDGRPLRYMLRDGQPAVWTIGVDRIDDRLSSVVPLRWADLQPWRPAGRVDMTGCPWPRGDVLLWPPEREDEETSGQPALIGP